MTKKPTVANGYDIQMAAEFLLGHQDAEAQANAYGYVQEFLSRVKE